MLLTGKRFIGVLIDRLSTKHTNIQKARKKLVESQTSQLRNFQSLCHSIVYPYKTEYEENWL